MRNLVGSGRFICTVYWSRRFEGIASSISEGTINGTLCGGGGGRLKSIGPRVIRAVIFSRVLPPLFSPRCFLPEINEGTVTNRCLPSATCDLEEYAPKRAINLSPLNRFLSRSMCVCARAREEINLRLNSSRDMNYWKSRENSWINFQAAQMSENVLSCKLTSTFSLLEH